MQAANQPGTVAITAAGALLAGLAVALGAFAAHAMKAHYEASALQTFETGVRYQMYHAIALLACGIMQGLGYRTRLAAILFATGILLFSGSLYGLVLLRAPWLGPVTPIGGVAFLCGWVALILAARKRTVPARPEP